MLPVQFFLVVCVLGVWFTVPKIQEDLTMKANQILREEGVDSMLKVKFNGPVATLNGQVEHIAQRDRVVKRIESMENIWGLKVQNFAQVQIIPPPVPVVYKMEFSGTELKITGNLPGELEKRALVRKAGRLFPLLTVVDETVLPNADAGATAVSRSSAQIGASQNFLDDPRNSKRMDQAGMGLSLLEELPYLHRIGQLRWVEMKEGVLAFAADLPYEDTRPLVVESIKKLAQQSRPMGIKVQAVDLEVIASPSLELDFGPPPQLVLNGKLASASDQALAVEHVQALFPKAKIEPAATFDPSLGPVYWILPKLDPLRGLQSMGRFTKVAVDGGIPVVEAETLNVSAQLNLALALDKAFGKEVRTNVTVTGPLFTTTMPPSLWATIGEDRTVVTGTVADEPAKLLAMEKLSAIFPSLTFEPELKFDPKVASAKLYMSALDPVADLAALEPNFVMHGFGLVEGRLKLTGVVPDNATKERLTGMILKRHLGRVSAELTVDPAYLPSPESFWSMSFTPGRLKVTGQLCDKQLKATLLGDLKAIYPNREITENLEIVPHGLRKGNWPDLLRGLSVVAAPEQTTEILWQNGKFILSAKVPGPEAQARMLRRLQRTYGTQVEAKIEVMDNPALASVPSVALVDCTIYFETTQRDFMTQEAEKIQQVLTIMETHPEVKLSIQGFTDDKGSYNGNISLSLNRADTVRKWLMRRKIEPERISIQGHGPKFPVADNKTEQGRAANRRLQFRVQ